MKYNKENLLIKDDLMIKINDNEIEDNFCRTLEVSE